MGDVSSAIPNDLILYGGNAESHNRQLQDWARNVTQALDSLRRSHPDPGLLPSIPDLGAVLNAYAVKKEAIDKFVYDVGMAFLEISNSPDLNAKVTVDDSKLNGQLDKDEGAQGRKYADDVASGKMPLDQALAMIGDDPIETAAFFKELGAPGTLRVVGDIQDDPDLLRKFDEALATATQSPTWDPSFTDQLANGDYFDFEDLGPPERRWALTASLLKYGTYSEDFLTKIGDQFLFHQKDDGVNHGAELALDALTRNPDVALKYLNGTDPTDHDRTRLNHLLENGVGLTSVMPGGEEEFQKYQKEINDRLGLTTLAANSAPDADNESVSKLLESISKVPVSVVPEHYRDVVTQLIGLDMELMGDKLPSGDPNHPEDATDSPLSWEDRQRLFLIAMYDVDPDSHQLVPNPDRIDRLREEVLGWAMQGQNLSAKDPTVWLQNAASVNALMTDGLAAYPYYQEELAKQQEEFSAIFAGVLLAVALPAGAVSLGALGVGEITAAGIEAATHIAIEITDEATKSEPKPAWETADEQVNVDLANFRATMVVNAYEHDPNASWIPAELRGKSANDPEVLEYLTSVTKADSTADLPDQYKHDASNAPAGQLITQLNAYSGLFKRHDPHQVQEMLD
jgi:hypothetical protein